MDLGAAHRVARAGDWQGAPLDVVSLDYDSRLLRRKRLITRAGAVLRVDLPELMDLRAGDALALAAGGMVSVEAAEEALLKVSGPNLARLAWHIGNRHTPCQIFETHLRIRADHVLQAMLEGLGATVIPLQAAFEPEGGAYGHGRTMGHAHD